MLSKMEAVWRHLLHRATEGACRHPSVTAVANELGFAFSTTHKALCQPVAIGAVTISPSGGLRVLDPFRIAVLWAGRRRFDRDLVDTWLTEAPAPEVERRIAHTGAAVLGGHGAVVARLGRNSIADYSTVIVYANDNAPLRAVVPESVGGPTSVVVAEPDALLGLYGNVTRASPGLGRPVHPPRMAGVPVRRGSHVAVGPDGCRLRTPPRYIEHPRTVHPSRTSAQAGQSLSQLVVGQIGGGAPAGAL